MNLRIDGGEVILRTIIYAQEYPHGQRTPNREYYFFMSAKYHQGILLYDWDGRKSCDTRGQFETIGIESVLQNA
jgi:hypothetical protein